LLLKKMATFVDLLSESSREKWAELYRKFMGKKWTPPAKDKQAIQCETKIENLAEIDKLMKEKPGYSVDVQEREG